MKEEIKKYLNSFSNDIYEVNENKLDPIIIANEYNDEYIALVAALFAYGNVRAILKFLRSIDFSFFKTGKIPKHLYYRFQSPKDTFEFFKTLYILKKEISLKEIFLKGYSKEENIMDGLREVIQTFYKINPYNSKGYQFLIGKIPPYKTKGVSPYKRWNMFLRWMVRNSDIDLGLWREVDKSKLIIPLDTHTHNISLKLGIIDRKSYDLESAILLTNELKKLDENDPLKYDFILYRIGQLKL